MGGETSGNMMILGWDYTNQRALKIRVLPDGSISLTASVVVDEGIATAGTATTLTDTTKNWEVDLYEGGIVEIIHGATSYQRLITANTANQLTFATLGVAVAAGDVYRIMRNVDPMVPQDKGVIHNTAYVTPNDFFGADLTPTVQPTLFRFQGAFSAAGVLSVAITRGGNTQVVNFNHGVALTPEDLFGFDHLVQNGTTINYRYSVNCTIRTFSVLEIPAAI